MDLNFFYQQMTSVLWPISISGKMVLLVALGLSMRMPFRFREHIITGLIAFQFLFLAYINFVLSASARVIDDELTNHIFVVILSAGCLISAIAFGFAAFQVEGRWNLKSENEFFRWVGWGLIIFGFVFPFFSKSILSAIFFAPVGIIPHPTLLIVSGMLIAGYPNCARLPMAAIIMACGIIGGLDFAAGLQTYWLPLGCAVFMSGMMVYSAIKSGGILEDDRPPIDLRLAEKKKALFAQKTKEKKTWKLK